MLEIRTKRPKIGLWIALIVLACGLLLMIDDQKLDYFFIVVVFVLSAIVLDFGSIKYTLNSEGLHQHWFLHTDHYSWNSFTEVSIEPLFPSESKKAICFNRNISYINQGVNAQLHPFRFFVFQLVESGDPNRVPNGVLMDEILALLEENNVPVTYYSKTR
ncbi:MAG: hypothetical protein HPZ79_04650 [Oscillospiraceae bacterium]|nr:hypothetical protein [Oscillospiraceae bacterium]